MLVFDENGNMVVAEDTPQNTEQPPAPTPAPAPSAVPAAESSTPPPATPAPETVESPEAAEDPGLGDYLTDIPKGIYNGVISAGQETGQFAWDVGNALGFTDDEKMPYYDSLEELKAQTTTMAGKLTEDVVNFGLGMVSAGKFLKVAKVFQGAGKAASIGRMTTAGAISDFVVMDPMQERLSNLVQQYPTLANPLTEGLQAEEGDSRWEGRLKNAAEGVLLGGALDTLIGSVKALRAWKRGDKKAMGEALDAVERSAAGGPPVFREASPEEFITLRETSSRPEFLTPYSAEDMADWRRFTTNDGVGFAIKPDGDIVGVVNNSGKKGAGVDAVIEALVQGGKTLDCVGGHLSDYYPRFGFVENKAKRMAWDDVHAPKGWDYDKYGRPNVYFYEYPEGLSRNREDIRRRFEASRGGKAGGGPVGSGPGNQLDQQTPSGVRPGMDKPEPGPADRGTGTHRQLLDEKAPHAGASSFDPPDPLHAEFAAAAKADPGLDTGSILKEAGENTKSTAELLERLPQVLNQRVLNPRRMAFMDDKALKLNETVCEAVYDRTLRSEGVESINALTVKALDDLRAIDGSLDTARLVEALERTTASSAEGRAVRMDVLQLRQAHNLMTLRLSELGETFSTMGAKDSDEALKMMAEMDAICQMMGKTTVAIRDAGTTAGRNLRAFRQIADGTGLLLKDAPNVEQAIRQAIREGRIADPREWVEKLKNVDFRQMVNDPRYAQGVARAMGSKNGIQMLKEYYISSILYGVRTHLTNTVSNAAQIGFTPFMRALGSIPEKGFTEAALDTARVYKSMARNVGAALEFSKRAFRESKGILDSTSGASFTEGLSRQSAWTAENVKGRAVLKNMQQGMNPKAAMDAAENDWLTRSMATAVNGLGKFVRLPGRFLEAQDEFFKQLAYRSEVEAAAFDEAVQRFGARESKKIAEYVKAKCDLAFDEAGRATDKTALHYARRMTFTQPLKPSSIAKGIQDYGNREGWGNSLVKLTIPFVRTPTNILVGSIEYLPFLQRVSSHCREALARGGREAAEMRGKAATGGLIIAGGLMAAVEGRITGSTPEDGQLREAGQRIGWQPYSFKVGDTYVSYQRMDPIAPLLTFMADFVAASPYLSRDQHQEFGEVLATSLQHMLTDKSYFQGIQNLMGLITGDNRMDIGRWSTQLASGMVPNFVRETSRGWDEFQRDIRTAGSRLQQTIPGWSQSLPAKHDWLTGQPVAGGVAHLFGLSSINDDPVAYELASLGGIMKAPMYKMGNGKVELTEEQHSRYCQLIGTTKLEGKTLHETLNHTIHSAEYDLERKDHTEVDGFRSKWLKKICNAYKKAALRQLQDEYPELAQAVREEKQERSDNRETKRSIQAEGIFRTPAPNKRATETEQLRRLANL